MSLSGSGRLVLRIAEQGRMLLVLLLLRWMELRLRHGRLGRCRAVGRDVRHGSLLRAGPEALEGWWYIVPPF